MSAQYGWSVTCNDGCMCDPLLIDEDAHHYERMVVIAKDQGWTADFSQTVVYWRCPECSKAHAEEMAAAARADLK